MNKFLVGAMLSFFCLGNMQECCLGLGLSDTDKAAKQQRKQHDSETKAMNKEIMRAFNKDVVDLKKEQKKDRDETVKDMPLFYKGFARYGAWRADRDTMPLSIARKTGKTDSLLLFEQVKSWGEYVKVLSKYCSKVIRHKLPVSGEKLDKDDAAVIRSLVEFANALVKGKATKDQWNEVLNILSNTKLTKTGWDVLNVARVGLVDLINNNLNELPETSHQLAKLAVQNLTNKFNIDAMREKVTKNDLKYGD